MLLRLELLLLLGTGAAVCQDTIFWNSDAGADNRMSNGQPMDGGFRFELGVFADNFIPTATNLPDWSEQWSAARRIPYNASTKRYADSFGPSNNATPFTIGKAAWVWGFRGSAQSGEWILFRAESWTWPDSGSFPPGFREWFAKDAVPPVLGSVLPSGTPWLMQSAAVNEASPPVTTWAQWQAEELAGEAASGTNDDPDKDGLPNLMEFVFGTPPRLANTPVTVSVGTAEVAGLSYAQITIPRRIDHKAILTVEVSGDLVVWSSGSSFTNEVSNTAASLVVRDLTPISSAAPRRFLRLKASLP